MKKNIFFWLFSVLILSITFTGCDDDDDDNGPPVDPNTVVDVDGNVYPTIVIGNQEWMAENLKTTRYSDGSNIEYPGNDVGAWISNSSGAYAWYNDDENFKNQYGALYNWFAVTNSSGLCPAGWRVSTHADWTTMRNYLQTEFDLTNDLGDVAAVGSRLKSCRQVDSPQGGDCNTSQHPRWNAHETHFGTNDFGLAILPGGGRGDDGIYYYLGVYGYLWTSTADTEEMVHYRSIHFDQSPLFMGTTTKNVGTSVRCIKN